MKSRLTQAFPWALLLLVAGAFLIRGRPVIVSIQDICPVGQWVYTAEKGYHCE